MSKAESAEEAFARRLGDAGLGIQYLGEQDGEECWQATFDAKGVAYLIAARDAELTREAKLEVLAELRSLASSEEITIPDSNTIIWAHTRLLAKYQPAAAEGE